MPDTKTTGEAIQVIRRALYDLTRTEKRDPRGATENQIVDYCHTRGWPNPRTDLEKAIGRLHESGAVEVRIDAPEARTGRAEPMYWLTAHGDLEEEAIRRGYVLRLLDELRRPRTFVDLVLVVLTFVLGLIAGLLIPR